MMLAGLDEELCAGQVPTDFKVRIDTIYQEIMSECNHIYEWLQLLTYYCEAYCKYHARIYNPYNEAEWINRIGIITRVKDMTVRFIDNMTIDMLKDFEYNVLRQLENADVDLDDAYRLICNIKDEAIKKIEKLERGLYNIHHAVFGLTYDFCIDAYPQCISRRFKSLLPNVSDKLNNTLVRLCIAHAKMQAPRKAEGTQSTEFKKHKKTKGTNGGIVHAANKLNCLDSKLHQALDSIKKLSGNIGANDETTAQVAITDGQTCSLDSLNIINIKLEQSIDTLDQSIDELTQIINNLMMLTSQNKRSTSFFRSHTTSSQNPPLKMSVQNAQPTLNSLLDTPYTRAELAKRDGSNPELGIWVAIKGIIFDVSYNTEAYGPGGVYSVFAGKDVSRAMAKSSLRPVDCVPNYDDLGPEELKVLDRWVEFFRKRYNIVGKVVD
jgi:membrane-associated progesterone receptor component